MPYTSIAADDARLTWSGAVSLQRGDGWVMPWRLPCEDLALYPPDTLRLRAGMASGVRLRFATDATEVLLLTEAMEVAGCLDVYADGAQMASVAFAEGDTVHAVTLPGTPCVLEIWLHQFNAFRLREIRLNPGAQLEFAPDTRPKWVTYGSSITHCRTADSPSCTWPGVVARAMGLNLTSLGLGGECHADPMMARLIRDLPADLVSVKLGINIYGGWSLNPRSFRPAVIGTLATIRERHSDIPLVVCSPIFSPNRETTPNGVGMTLEIMRREIAEVVDIFCARGDAQIYYVNGLDLFGSDLAADHLPDNLHPDAEGYRIMGQNFLREVFARQGVRVARTPQTTTHERS